MTHHWFLTTYEVALATPVLGAPIGAGITVFAQRFSNQAALKAQRQVAEQNIEAQQKLASDNRMWDKHAEIYPPLIAKLQARQAMLTPAPVAPTLAQAKDFCDMHGLDIIAVMAQMQAWSGPIVGTCWTVYFEGQRQLAVLIDVAAHYDVPLDQVPLPFPEKVRTMARHTSILAANLIIAMKGELQGFEPDLEDPGERATFT